MGNTMTANIKCTENNIGKHAASFFDLWLKKKKGVDGIVRHRFVPSLGGLSFEEYRRKQEELFSNYLSSHVLLVQLSDNAKGNSNCGVDFGNFLLQKSHNYFSNIKA